MTHGSSRQSRKLDSPPRKRPVCLQLSGAITCPGQGALWTQPLRRGSESWPNGSRSPRALSPSWQWWWVGTGVWHEEPWAVLAGTPASFLVQRPHCERTATGWAKDPPWGELADCAAVPSAGPFSLAAFSLPRKSDWKTENGAFHFSEREHRHSCRHVPHGRRVSPRRAHLDPCQVCCIHTPSGPYSCGCSSFTDNELRLQESKRPVQAKEEGMSQADLPPGMGGVFVPPPRLQDSLKDLPTCTCLRPPPSPLLGPYRWS